MHRRPERITVSYPLDGALFPPEFPAPQIEWRDPSPNARIWKIEVSAAEGAAPTLRAVSRGEPPKIGEIDQRAVGPTNKLPELTPEQAATHTWRPDPKSWAAIKKQSVERPAIVTIAGYESEDSTRPISQGRVDIRTSTDPIGAPVFYRDVPLMPSKGEHGVIRPLDKSNVPLIAWRIRNLADTKSRVVMTGIHSCANCHSVSRDGATMGMDVDGPKNDKGVYALFPIKPQSAITLQVFYPTRGILAWYSKESGRLEPLPGADDPRYVHVNATWSADGKFLVFARAEARDAYPPGQPLAKYSNDPNETQIKYDLYRIPFNDGRGGKAEPIAGASNNGMSNSFPKITPDGRFVIFVEARNGQLMRPDGKLHIVPVAGGTPRLMKANTPLMNSWHSISPNGRWMVFSSKSRTPFTQMFLTHLDADGNDTPAVLVENSTAANRAVNIPEFVNIPPDQPFVIDAAVTEYYKLIDMASDAMDKGDRATALPLYKQALDSDPRDPFIHNAYGSALATSGRLPDAMTQFGQAIALSPDYPDPHNNLASAMAQSGNLDRAIVEYGKALERKSDYTEAHLGLGAILAQSGRLDEAIPHLKEAADLDEKNPAARANLCLALVSARRPDEAIPQCEQAVNLSGHGDPRFLEMLGKAYADANRLEDAIGATRHGVDVARAANDEATARHLGETLATYEAEAAGQAKRR